MKDTNLDILWHSAEFKGGKSGSLSPSRYNLVYNPFSVETLLYVGRIAPNPESGWTPVYLIDVRFTLEIPRKPDPLNSWADKILHIGGPNSPQPPQYEIFNILTRMEAEEDYPAIAQAVRTTDKITSRFDILRADYEESGHYNVGLVSKALSPLYSHMIGPYLDVMDAIYEYKKGEQEQAQEAEPEQVEDDRT